MPDRPPIIETVFQQSSLCVVGNINRDVKTSAVTANDNLFHDGETSVSRIVETIGGGGANSAFTASALGAHVAFLGKIGSDALGGRLERTLHRHRVTSRLTKDARQPTGTSIALAFAGGQRHFISCLPASRALSPGDLDLTVLADHQHLLRADIWFSDAMLNGGNMKLFEEARRRGVAVSIDLNWDPHWGQATPDEIRARKESVRALLPLTDLAHGNARELMEFTDAPDLNEALKRLSQWGTRAVVVHLGNRGAGCYQNGSLIVQPPAPAKALVNTAGTGDVLSVCMMLLHHRSDIPIPERLGLANQIVAEFVEGKRSFIPELED